MHALTASELRQLLDREPLWSLDHGKLTRVWTFPDFITAMVFVNRVAALAEEAGHHPDIDIRYNTVRLGLVTHDAGGITARDAAMAERLNQAFLAPIPSS